MFSSNSRGRKLAKQRGLTLIELVVVLTILVALGSLLVPVIGNALSRSHVATCSQTIPEVNSMLQLAVLTSGDIGDGWTTGVDQTGATVNAGLTTGTLSTDQVDALNDLGITNVFNHDTTVADYAITFNPGLTTEVLSDTTDVIVLTDAQAEGVFLQTAGDEQYIWLGIDTSWSLLGTLTAEPPTHFGDTPGAFPDEAYSRFGAIIQVADADGNAIAEVKRASYSVDGEGNFETADNHIGIFWEEIQE